jgi:hypothetical protein
MHVTFLVERGPAMAQEGRLDAVQQATRAALDALAPTDLVSIAVYGDQGKLVLPAEPLGDGQKARRLLGFLDAQQVGAGANLLAGLKAVNDDRVPHEGPRRVLVFTAAAAIAQERDVELAVRAWGARGVGLAAFGLGTGWNATFLTRLADATRGNVHAVPRTADLAPALREELGEIYVLGDVRLRMRLSRGVRLRRFMQVFPHVAHWLPVQPTERDALARVGELPGDRPCYMLAELVVPPQAEGTVRLATLDALYGPQGATPAVELVTAFGPQASPPDREVAHQAGVFQAYTLVERALEARREHQPERLRAFLENARRLAAPELAERLEKALAANLPVGEGLAIELLLTARRPE